MEKLIFITHPEVIVDPQIDVRRWRLSDAGLERMRVFADSPVVANVTSVLPWLRMVLWAACFFAAI